MSSACNLAQFYDQVKGKGVRLTNQWKMKFVFGEDESGVLAQVQEALDGEKVSVWAEGTVIPGRTQEFLDLPYQGYNLGIPGAFAMTNELEFTFRGQRNLTYKHAFETWMDVTSNIDFAGTGGDGSRVQPALGSAAVAGGGYKGIPNVDLEITLMHQDMVTEFETYVLRGISPMAINDIDLTNDAPEILNYGVGFRIQYWYRTEPNIVQ